MEVINPATNPPILAPPSPNRRYLHSRSASISPTRAYSPLGYDPLLRCLSPTSTLLAFTSSPSSFQDSRSPSPRRITLENSFKNVSEEQKELGCKAAQACLDIRGWTYELEGWEWPGCFEEPDPVRKPVRASVMSIGSLASGRTVDTIDEEESKEDFWGSLPATVVTEYDERLQEISTQLDDIDLEELKDYTLHAHMSSNTSTPRLQHSDEDTSSSPDLRQLDDFTTVVTATILQTLPFINKLARLLDDWSARITTLKNIPSFLRDLDRLRTDLDHGWAAVAVSLRKNGMYASLGSEHMEQMQSVIDSSMTSLAQRLDTFLDTLEGRQDTVPDMFLDKFEELEERYAEWVVMAQRRVLGDELKSYQAEPLTPTTASLNATDPFDRSKTPTIHDRPSIERSKTPNIIASDPPDRSKTPTLLPGIEFTERARTPTFFSTSDVVERAITPSIGDVDSMTLSDEQDLARGDRHSRFLHESKESLKPVAEQVSTGQSLTALPQPQAARDSTLLPSTAHSTQSRDVSPTRSTRHIPILLPFDGDGSEYQSSLAASSASLHATGRSSNIKPITKTNAYEKSSNGSPQKQPKSPVRQASNAFVRLFKRERKQGIQSESKGALTSQRSAKRKPDAKLADNSTVWGGRPDSPTSSLNVRRATSSSTMQSSSIEGAKSVQSDRGRVPHTDQETLNILEPATDNTTTQPAVSQPSEIASTISKNPPPTYQPNGLIKSSTSPKEARFPENWPLMPGSANTAPTKRQSATLRDSTVSVSSEFDFRTVRSMAAMGTDAFDTMFVNDFPSVPSADHQSGYISFDFDDTYSDTATEVGQPRAADETVATAQDEGKEDTSVLTATHKLSIPTVTSSMLSSNGRQDDLSVARAISVEGLRQFDKLPLVSQHDFKERYMSASKDDRGSSLPMAGEADNVHDNITTPDDDASLYDADLGYFHPPAADLAPAKPASSAVHSQRGSQDHDISNLAGLAAVQAVIIHAEMPAYPPPLPAMPDGEVLIDNDSPVEKRTLKRASMASIKAHLASEVRSIDVPARRSLTRQDNTQESSENVTPAFESASESRRDSSSYFAMPVYTHSGSRSRAQSPTSSMETPNFSRLRSSSVDTNDQRPPPLNSAISKKRRTAPMLETIQPSAEYDAEPATQSSQSSKHDVPVDKIDRHVSEVLEKIPAPIRFRARGAEDMQSPALKTHHIKSRHSLKSRQSSGSGGLTLTPVEVLPKKSSSDGSSIKVYHLTQAGREDPIKLFVRLVGENDRVMVRVGGGWADLADYLKRYAEHHGSRTVSGAGLAFELQSAGSTPAGSRRASGAANTAVERRLVMNRDDGSLVGTGMTSRDDNAATIEGYAELAGSDVEATLRSVNTRLESQPTTSNAEAISTLSSRSSIADLRKQKADDAASDHKARWVETMLERARKQTSGAKSRKDVPLGDLGKVGSTQRVVVRSASAQDSRKAKE